MATNLTDGSKAILLASIRDAYTVARLYGVNISTTVPQVVSTSDVSITGNLTISLTTLSNSSAIVFQVAQGLRPTKIEIGISNFSTNVISIDITGAGAGQFEFTTAGTFTIPIGDLTITVA